MWRWNSQDAPLTCPLGFVRLDRSPSITGRTLGAREVTSRTKAEEERGQKVENERNITS